MNENFLNKETIKAAVAGEKWAVEKVVDYYSEYIDQEATVEKKESDGSVTKYIDEDLRQHLILGLIEALPNFDLENGE